MFKIRNKVEFRKAKKRCAISARAGNRENQFGEITRRRKFGGLGRNGERNSEKGDVEDSIIGKSERQSKLKHCVLN